MTKNKVQSELQEQKQDDSVSETGSDESATNTQNPVSYTSSTDAKPADEELIDKNEDEPLNKGVKSSEKMPAYKVGDVSNNGDVIGHIYGKTSDLIVFRCENTFIKWEYWGDDDALFCKATGEHEAHRVSIPFDTPENIKQSIIHQLALSLYNAINDGNTHNAFAKVSKRINALLTPNQAKLRLILFSLICTTLFGVSLLVSYNYWGDPHRLLLATGGAGILGSMFSLLQRNTEVKIPQDNGDFYIFLQALFTCVLGLMSGLFVYLFSKSDFPLAISNQNVYSILIFSIIAGFSERIIPDLFDGVPTKGKQNS